VHGARKRQISGQMNGRPVVRERRRAVWLDRVEIPLDVERGSDAILVSFVDAEGKAGAAHRLVSSWTPGDLTWQGTFDGTPIAVQVRNIPNGFKLAHQGVEAITYVFTATEAASAALMPVETRTDVGKRL